MDLGGDQLDLMLTPEVKDPALVSVAATVHVTGPLANPSYRPTRRSLARTFARGVFSNILRPTQPVLRQIRGEAEAEPSVCLQLLAADPRSAREWFAAP